MKKTTLPDGAVLLESEPDLPEKPKEFHCSVCAKNGKRRPGPLTVLMVGNRILVSQITPANEGAGGSFCFRHAHWYANQLARRGRQMARYATNLYRSDS